MRLTWKRPEKWLPLLRRCVGRANARRRHCLNAILLYSTNECYANEAKNRNNVYVLPSSCLLASKLQSTWFDFHIPSIRRTALANFFRCRFSLAIPQPKSAESLCTRTPNRTVILPFKLPNAQNKFGPRQAEYRLNEKWFEIKLQTVLWSIWMVWIIYSMVSQCGCEAIVDYWIWNMKTIVSSRRERQRMPNHLLLAISQAAQSINQFPIFIPSILRKWIAIGTCRRFCPPLCFQKNAFIVSWFHTEICILPLRSG